jgi:hypothetical protein
VRVLLSPYELKSMSLLGLVRGLCDAGLLRIPDPNERSDSLCFDVPAPAGVESVAWARRNAELMSQEGLNAVAAPMWPVESCRKPRGMED